MNIYLASPYTGPPEKQEARYRQICRISAELRRTYKDRHFIYSPICHSHGIALYGGLAGDHKTWEHDNLTMLKLCDELWVAPLPGWRNSEGLKWELDIAEDMGKPVRFI